MLRRLVPIAVLVLILLLALVLDLQNLLSLETLRANRAGLIGLVERDPVTAALIFVVVYAASVAVSLPGATFLTLAGGFLFGFMGGLGLSVVGASVGATGVFLAARFALSDFLRARAGPWLSRLRDGFSANAFSYLLFLRLVPVFPFFAVNLAPAFLGVPTRVFISATAIGIVPGTAVVAAVGSGLGEVLDRGGDLEIAGLFTPGIVGGLIGLALLSLMPVAIGRWRRR